MIRKRILQIIGVIGVVCGGLSLLYAVTMWLGSMIVTPVGFLFGLGEAMNYATPQEGLTNLFWHVLPGIMGAVTALLFLIIALLLLWGSRAVWSRTKDSLGESAP